MLALWRLYLFPCFGLRPYVHQRNACLYFRRQFRVFWDGMAWLVDLGYKGQGLKLLLSHEAKAFLHFWQILD